jgi:ethanolamine utilization protein EutN
MRLASIIGRVTLGVRHPAFQGERLMLVLPWSVKARPSAPHYDPSIVAYDELGAGPGQMVAVSESGEAASPFVKPTPVDAYCAALVDEMFWPETQEAHSTV